MVRPLVRAILAGLLVLVGLGSVVATDQAHAALLVPPEVHAGDRGAYAASLEYRDGTPVGPRAGHWTGLTFLWHDGALRSDERGVPHAVHVLETYTTATPGDTWTSSWALWSLDAATGATVAVDNRWQSDGYTAVVATPGRWTTVGNTTTFGEGGPVCGLRSSLQGYQGAPPKTAWMEGACGDDGALGPGGRTDFVLEGRDTVGGAVAWRYAPAAGGAVRVWFSSGVATPVQVLQPSVAGEQVRDVLLRLRLTGWEAGDAAESVPVAPAAEPAPAFALARPDRWLGPPLGNLKHPFPHTEAWKVALADSRSGLADFISAHPESYLLMVYGYHAGNLVHATMVWDFTVTDGKAALEATVKQVDPGLPPLLPDATRYDVSGHDPNIGPLWLPDPGQVPTGGVPSFGDVGDRWALLRGRPLPDLPVYGFGSYCLESGCGKVGSWSFVGESTGETANNGTTRGSWDTLLVELPEGTNTLQHQDYQTVAQVGIGNFRPLPPLDASHASGAPPAGPATLATRWIATPAGAGTFAAAILVAVLTYLWPSLKSGALGLFSRLSPDALAGHPTRQAILDAVAAQPGIHFQALCRALGKGRGVVGHHLGKLVDGGRVVAHRQGGFVCYVVKGQDAGSAVAAGALKAEGAQRLLRELAARPGLSGLELAGATGLSPSTVHYHLRRLEEAGLVASAARGRSRAMRLTPAGERAGALAAPGGVA